MAWRPEGWKNPHLPQDGDPKCYCIGVCEKIFEQGAGAMLIEVMAWGEEPCPHYPRDADASYIPKLKRECPFCWAELRREVSDDQR